MPSINDLIRDRDKKVPKGKKAKETKSMPSSGNTKSKIRSKHGLPPGYNGIIKSKDSVMRIKVDAKGRERVISYIPQE